MSDDTHRDVIQRFESYWDDDKDNRDDALEDLKFQAGDQWPDKVRKQRESDGRPVLMVNRIGQFIKRVSGTLRKTHPAIEPIPVDDQSDPILADIYAGLIRQIEYQSGASAAYAWGGQCAIACGIGHWRIDTKYTDGSFDQEICIKRIVDPLAVIWDGASEIDRSDAMECFVTEWVTEQEFKRRFPKANVKHPSDFPVSGEGDFSLYWRSDSRIRIASQWFKSPVKRTIGMTAGGQVFDITKMSNIGIQTLGITREREIEDFEIKHRAISGDDFLTDMEDWAGRHIPIVPVIGEEIAFDGRTVRHGVVRWAKDPQRLYNYWRSAAAEAIALAPKAPFLVPYKSIEGLEKFWNKANTANLPYLPYNPLDGFPQHVPQRAQGAQPPSAMWQEAAVASDDMKATTGIYDAALGNRSNETSGVAIEQRQEETDTGTFVYFDNFNQAIRRTGQILVDLIPKIYDGERVARIIGKSGEEEFVPINKVVMDLDGPVLVNDITTAKFDVRIKTGANYANAKEEARAELGALLQAAPQLMGVIGDLYVETLDFEGAKKIAERLKKTIPPQISGEPQQPDPMAQAAQRLEMAGAEAKVAETQAKAQKTMLEGEKIKHEIMTPEPGEPMPEPDGPSESIAYKDLPPEGQSQMLAKAGIIVPPEILRQHANNEFAKAAAMKAAQKPPQPARQ